ncbi:uncharacterized protein LOC143248407 [Tachypleus tridentatus]|uniref:uncharacterized protein LOC143248407 n=1 Tax=Tachypleus tridentatus TaxID=6853 RepID=UPI003FD63618
MGNGCPIAIRSVKLVFLIVLVTMTVANPLREDDTHLVMKSMNEFLHHLFPLVPTKTQYVWEITHQEPVLPLEHYYAPYKPNSNGQSFPSFAQPWNVDTDFRKRGPECMRKCIAEGILHPVQCHSLC